MDDEKFLISCDNGIATLTFNWPKEVNSLGKDFTRGCLAALDEIDEMPDLRVLILTGSGSVFCGGGNLFEIMGPDPQPIEQDLALLQGYNKVVDRLYHFRVPVIAAVNGPAIGGGVGIAMACDFAIASDTARYDLFFGLLGLAASDVGVSWLLTQHLGPARANYYTYTAASIKADECERLGLFAKVVPKENLMSHVRGAAERIVLSYSPLSASATKIAMRNAVNTSLHGALAYDPFMQTVAFQSPDHKTRIHAYQKKIRNGT